MLNLNTLLMTANAVASRGSLAMVGPVAVQRLRSVSRLALVAVLGGLAAACSSETLRISGDPFSNPFKSASAEPTTTSSPALATPEPVRTAAVHSQPLAPPTASSAPAIVPAAPRVAATSASGSAGWSAQGGARVTVAAGDSLASISNRYGVPAQAILSANDLKSGAQVTPGRSIVIPVYNASGAAQPAKSAAQASSPKARVAEVAKPAKPEPRQAKTEPAKPTKVAKVEPAKVQPVKAASAEPVKPAKPATQKVASIETKPVETAKPAAGPAPAKGEAKAAPTDDPKSTGALPSEPAGEFRWPARGRVIAGFGANGGNEGINISVPEGTPVKAAESGTVTYSGSEVKGYGNLVLIKHDNGYVSAYAHNGELSVKRGEKVKRGQVIAKAGQTGNVTSPQLHFEIRKGQTPVDPTGFLAN
jgi:murein DD-endopeptidase MepM/ murein hydrolase activator NlpD